MSSNDIAVAVRGLSKSYTIAHNVEKHTTMGEAMLHRFKKPLQRAEKETFWALKDLDFDIKKGDVVGIIGRNGAGKSTLLKILSQITEPTSGEIKLYGRVGSLLEVGTGFHPELTGRENIFLNGAILGMRKSEIERQFDAIVDFAEVEKFLDTPVKRYSSGMYVRLAFAVAAHLNPEILIVDEVLAVGDAEFQKKCLGKMQDVSKTGKTVLFVSHNMAAVKQLCKQVISMRAGRISAYGPTDDVLPDYLSDGTVASNGVYDLSTHIARLSIHRTIIRDLKLHNGDGNPKNTFFPDDELVIEMTISPDRDIREPRVAVAIEDSYGSRIMTLASYFHQNQVSNITSECKIICSLPEINLGSGRYLMSVSVADKYQGLIDSVNSAAWFEVEWNDNYKNGETYLPVYGPVLTNSTWSKSEIVVLHDKSVRA